MKNQPARRTAKFDEAISALQTELANVNQERREKVRDLTTDPDALAKLGAHMQVLRDKIEAQRELRAEAAKLDARDDFIRERDAMRQLQQELLKVLATRESDAQELDALCEQLGAALQRIGEKNEKAWGLFRTLAKYLTNGDARRGRYEGLIFANQSRIATGAAMSSALVAALRSSGLGRVGITENTALATVVGYRMERPISVQEATREANDRVARHLAITYKQKADEMLPDEEAA